MRLGKIMVFGAFMYASVANAQDVMVDLSVLDDLDAPAATISQPLFPVLPKKVNVEVKKPVKKEKVKSVKKDIKKVEASEKPMKKADVSVKPVDDIVVVDFEPVAETLQPEPVIEQKDSQSDVKDEVLPVAENIKSQPVVKHEVENNQETVEATAVSKVKQASVPSEDSSKDIQNELLIQEEVVSESTADCIRFVDGVDELTDAQMQEIDVIVSKYENSAKNKIAIYSYNFDDGIDSFKKKRISLNRALGIRSYLLKNGYKNFSIKVININTPSDKLNTVELQEI